MELAVALLENTTITYLELDTEKYTNRTAEAMAKYVHISKRSQRIRWNHTHARMIDDRLFHEEMLCCFLAAIQESTSLKELYLNIPLRGWQSSLALINRLTNTQSLRSLTLICQAGPLDDIAVAAARSGFKKNTTLRELTLELLRGTTTISTILTSLLDHPLLRRLCLRGYVADVSGLETVMLSDTSKITELDIQGYDRGLPMMGLTHVLQALAHRPTLTKLRLRGCHLGRDNARELGMVLGNTPSLQILFLRGNHLGSVELAELAPALYRNTSIKELDFSDNRLNDMVSAELLRGIIRLNKAITTLHLSGNIYGETSVECTADGLGSNSTLLKIHLSGCRLRDNGVSILAQTLGSRNTTLQKLIVISNSISSTGIGVLLQMMEQSSHRITDLDLCHNSIGDEGASLLARSLGNNALPNLTHLSLSWCDIGDDGVMTLMSALEQKTSLLQLDLCFENCVSGRSFLAMAESLPRIKMLERLCVCPGGDTP